MKILNGMDKPVAFTLAAILKEAGYETGLTSIVTCTCENGDQYSISQHSSGDWDISVFDDAYACFDEKDGADAVLEFMSLCQYGPE